jgi:hypothetical protein
LKRMLTNLIVLMVVFVVFALIVSPLRTRSINITILFFPTMQTSAEALAYASFAIGFLLAALLSHFDELVMRRRYKELRAEQRKSATPPTDSVQQETTTTAK